MICNSRFKYGGKLFVCNSIQTFNYPSMLITLDEEEIIPWAEAKGLPTDIPTLAQNDEVRARPHYIVEERINLRQEPRS